MTFLEKYLNLSSDKGALVTRNVACKILEVSQQNLNKMINYGRINIYKINKLSLAPINEVMAEKARRSDKKERLKKKTQKDEK